jgi:hypothetical protein
MSNTVRTALLFVALIAVVAVGVGIATATQRSARRDLSDEMAIMKSQIARLETQVVVLKSALENLGYAEVRTSSNGQISASIPMPPVPVDPHVLELLWMQWSVLADDPYELHNVLLRAHKQPTERGVFCVYDASRNSMHDAADRLKRGVDSQQVFDEKRRSIEDSLLASLNAIR